MKSPFLLFLFASVLGIATSQATVTLALGNPVSGSLTNLADSTGSTANGLHWGVVVDTARDGFDSAYSGGFSLITNLSGVSLHDATGSVSDDVFFFDEDLTTVTTPGTGQGGPGSIVKLAGMAINLAMGVNTGDAFRIIWFDRDLLTGELVAAGDHYGMLGHPALVLPLDGNIENYASNFAGPDPVRSADLTFVPEPSAALLGLLGSACFWRRHRPAR